MMTIIELKPDVIEFLENTGTIWVDGDERSFIVNNTWYKPTDDKGVYTVEFLQPTYLDK
jgi:hypothetical protein